MINNLSEILLEFLLCIYSFAKVAHHSEILEVTAV